MASSTDFFNQLVNANTKLNETNTRLTETNERLERLEGQVDAIRAATVALLDFVAYSAEAAQHNSQQNQTIICSLEKIAHNTCDLVNEAHQQTALQTAVALHTATLADLYARVNADAALAREREAALRAEIARCCPPEPVSPICHDEPCKSPKPLGPAPKIKRVE
jgi:uncharacterized protein YoxC